MSVAGEEEENTAIKPRKSEKTDKGRIVNKVEIGP